MQSKRFANAASFKGVICASAIAAAFCTAIDTADAAKRASVLQCGHCAVSTPDPDGSTRSVLLGEKGRLNSWGAQGLKTGDTVVVCNGIECVEYTWRGNDRFNSGTVISTVLPPPAQGGGGGGGGDFGGGYGGGSWGDWGGGGGGGGGGDCCGRVIVGPIEQQ
ncbi:hypothetical protein I5U73_12090 [Stenotrophomonas maltophilia]|nr:hypothetical protein [Stenotrophomonas maltophilia]